MTSDLVRRLKDGCKASIGYNKVHNTMHEAAAEITRLTAALEEAEKRGYDTAKEHAANSVFTSIANASVKGNGTNVSRRWLMDLIKTAQADIRAMVKP